MKAILRLGDAWFTGKTDHDLIGTAMHHTGSGIGGSTIALARDHALSANVEESTLDDEIASLLAIRPFHKRLGAQLRPLLEDNLPGLRVSLGRFLQELLVVDQVEEAVDAQIIGEGAGHLMAKATIRRTAAFCPREIRDRQPQALSATAGDAEIDVGRVSAHQAQWSW